jgi:hypothetical protein
MPVEQLPPVHVLVPATFPLVLLLVALKVRPLRVLLPT